MIGRLAMTVYEAFEAAYSGALSHLAGDPRFLAGAGRLHALLNLRQRLLERSLEPLRGTLGPATRRELTAALGDLRRVEAEGRSLQRAIQDLTDRLESLEAREGKED